MLQSAKHASVVLVLVPAPLTPVGADILAGPRRNSVAASAAPRPTCTTAHRHSQ